MKRIQIMVLVLALLLEDSLESNNFSLISDISSGLSANNVFCKPARPKRDADGEYDFDAKKHFEDHINYLLGIIPVKLDNAVEVIEETQKMVVFKRVTQGWSIVIGSWLDLYSDFVINNRSLGNFGPIVKPYNYGFTGFYGVGFGFPLLLGLPDDKLECGSDDFSDTLEEYKLSRGVNDLLSEGIPIGEILSILEEFDVWIRVKLSCILDFESSHIEAADIIYALDQLNLAMVSRVELESEDESSRSFIGHREKI